MAGGTPLVSLALVFSLHICARIERVATDGRCSGIMGEPPLTGERVTGAGVC